MAAGEAISAADVEKFGYCPLSWWLSRGQAPEEGEELARGEERHAEASEELRGIDVHESRAREAETGILYFAIAATIVATFGLTFVLRPAAQVSEVLAAIALIWLLAAVYFLYRAETLAVPGERHLSERILVASAVAASVVAFAAVSLPGSVLTSVAQGLEAIALAWLIGASFFLYRSLWAMQVARTYRAKYGVAGGLAYVDRARDRPKLFVSERHGLTGRPDAILVEGDHHIPVEMKTGRTPRGPLFSHILQVAAYCVLLEEDYGKPPPYGVIRYEGTSHEIEYNEDVKRLLLGKLQEMRATVARGEAHRNHNRPGKCVHCSRRSTCPERLA